MDTGDFSKRKKILILDRNLSAFTREDIAKDLVGKIETEFPGKFIILPVANKEHLSAVQQRYPEENLLFIYGRDDSTEFRTNQISKTMDNSIYIKSLIATSINSLRDYAEAISQIIRKYKI